MFASQNDSLRSHRSPLRRALLGAALTLGLAAPAAWADVGGWQTGGFAAEAQLDLALQGLLATGTNIREMASTVGGGWVIVTDQVQPQVLWGGPVPSACITQIHQYIQMGREIDVVAFTPANGWIVVAEDLGWHMGLDNLVPELEQALLSRMNLGDRITEVVFDADGSGWIVVAGEGRWWEAQSMEADLFAAAEEFKAQDRPIARIQMDFDRNWVLFAEDWFASEGIDQTCFDWIESWQREERSLDSVLLGPQKSWVMFSHKGYTPDFSRGIEAIEYGLGGIGPDGSHVTNIWKRMEELDIAGVALAVIEGGELRWARSYGQLEHGTQRFVRRDSPFDTASVSKTITSMLMLNLIDDPQVKLGLDTNVKQAAKSNLDLYTNELALWALYGPQVKGSMPFTQVTLRRCLSHTAAMLPHGSAAFLPGEELPGANSLFGGFNLSSTFDILFGFDYEGGDPQYFTDKMPWYQEDLFSDGGSWQPGQVYKYSGGGYMVAQAMAEEITGKDYRSLVQQRVLDPLGMTDASFDCPLPADFEARCAVPHDDAGQPLPEAERPLFPWASAGGLWSSARDLAEAVLTIMHLGTHPGSGEAIFSPGLASQMLTKQTPVGEDMLYGLGLRLSHSAVGWINNGFFWHDGDHGEAAARIAGSPAQGEGLVVLINGGGEGGGDLRFELTEAFKDFYGWH